MWQFLLFIILLLQFVIILCQLDIGQFLAYLPCNLPCNCHKSPFVNKDRGHILTGDLRIIKNNRLRRITCKVPKEYPWRISLWWKVAGKKWSRIKISIYPVPDIISANALLMTVKKSLLVTLPVFGKWKVLG